MFKLVWLRGPLSRTSLKIVVFVISYCLFVCCSHVFVVFWYDPFMWCPEWFEKLCFCFVLLFVFAFPRCVCFLIWSLHVVARIVWTSSLFIFCIYFGCLFCFSYVLFVVYMIPSRCVQSTLNIFVCLFCFVVCVCFSHVLFVFYMIPSWGGQNSLTIVVFVCFYVPMFVCFLIWFNDLVYWFAPLSQVSVVKIRI